MPNSGSVNQMLSSDLTAMSFGALSRLPSKLSASTTILPSFSVRVTRRVTECSPVMRRPWRSRALPLAQLALLRNTLKLPSRSLNFMIRLLGMSLTST
jgi:hypothetical protein